MKKNNKKGFTLAELLIVVAIIAVLVAIAIPVFSTQLEKAKEATDLSDIRSMYAEAAMAVLNGTVTTTETSGVTGGNITTTAASGKTWIQYVDIGGFEPHQQTGGWVIDVSDVAGKDISSCSISKGTTAITLRFTFDENGKFQGVAKKS